MTTNIEIKPWESRSEEAGDWLAEYAENMGLREKYMQAEIADLRAALEAKQQALEAAQQHLAAIEPPSFSRDPDGDLALDWRVGDASLSASFSASGLVSWATLCAGVSAKGSQQVAQRAGSGEAKPICEIRRDRYGYLFFFPLIDANEMQEGTKLFTAPPAAVQPDSRFFMDHGQWHDRVTGQHLWTQDQYDQQRIDWYKQGKEDAMLEQPDSGRDTCAQCGDTQEKAAQRKRVKDRFASWPASPATADFDLPMAIADDRADSGRDAALRPGIEYGPVVLAAMAAQQGEQAPGAKGRT